jgi:hypothetical protein
LTVLLIPTAPPSSTVISNNLYDPLLTHAVLADFSDARYKEIYSALHDERSEKHRREFCVR